MSKKVIRTYSKHTQQTVKMLAMAIMTARKQQGLSEAKVAERVSISRSTYQRIEQASLEVGIGLYFEAAQAVGVYIFNPDEQALQQRLGHYQEVLNLLPKAAHTPKREVDDNF